jgi:DNA-directed RNA polymerase subunit D
MNASIVKENDAMLTLHLKGVSTPFVNALRRAVISDLPAFAIDEVDFYENNSPLFNEYLANRIGLVPLTFDENAADDVKITFQLNVESTDETRTVYSSELVSTDPAIRVFAERIPLIKLGKNQKLRLEATAITGTAKKHAKFQSALASSGGLPEFKKPVKCVKCSHSVKVTEEKILAENITLSSAIKCDSCGAFTEVSSEDALNVTAKEGEFVFFIESFNNIPSRKQLERAISVMQGKLKELEQELK